MEEIIIIISRRKYIFSVFIDLKKAFETVNHALLIHKSELYGVGLCGPAKMWLNSYIHDRKQIDDCKSTLLNVNCGPTRIHIGTKALYFCIF